MLIVPGLICELDVTMYLWAANAPVATTSASASAATMAKRIFKDLPLFPRPVTVERGAGGGLEVVPLRRAVVQCSTNIKHNGR